MVPTPASARIVPGVRRLVSPVLVARAEELALVDAAAARAAEGVPAAAIVGGEAGVGKTRLLEAAGERLGDAGFVVLRGACVELGGEALPFAPLVDALRSLSRSLSSARLEEVLGPARPMLARLLPELADGGAVVDVQPARLFELTLGLLGRLAEERPVAFFVEDLHWADEGTRDLVAFLIRALRDERVLLVLTYRSDELQRGHPLRHALAELERVRSVERVELRRFTRDEVREQLTAIRGDVPPATLVDLVYDRSEGNAFLVEEMLVVVESGGAEVPPSLRDVLLARVDRLTETTQRVLRAAAVAGGPVSEPLLAATTRLAEPELLGGLREAVEHHLLIVDDTGGYRFRHALARDAVYEDLLPGERGRLHAAFGAAIEAEPAPVAAALAWHWYAALDLPRALAASVRAAREAAAAHLPVEAERHSQRALELWDRVPEAADVAGIEHLALLELALQMTVESGHETRTLAHAADALAEVDAEREPRRAALILVRRAEALRRLRRNAMAIPDLEEARRLLGDEPTRELAAALAAIANVHVLEGNDELASELGARAVDVARTVGARDVETDALLSAGGALAYLGEFEQGLAALREGLTIAQERGDWESCLRAHVNISDALELHGHHEEAASTAADGVELARRAGLDHTLGVFLRGNCGESLIRLGRYAEAESVLDDALAVGVSPASVASPILVRAELAAARGEVALGNELTVRARAIIGDEAPHQYEAHLAWTEAELARIAGNEAAARAAVDRGLAGGEKMLGRYTWPLVWLGLRIETGTEAPARDRVDALARVAEGLDSATTSAMHYQATVAAELAGDDPTAWQAAADGWREGNEQLLLAYSLYRLGRTTSDALREAVAIARGLGAAPLLAEAEALARRLRVDIPVGDQGRAASDDRFGLTERELDVLRLVAAGRSNSEIGKELFISPKTASVHVSNILGKLGVARRGEAAATAHQLGLLA
jgi:DNA-binding CsgD family transcriptional regulator/tetratricopeptide (TPR) repeat protein